MTTPILAVICRASASKRTVVVHDAQQTKKFLSLTVRKLLIEGPKISKCVTWPKPQPFKG